MQNSAQKNTSAQRPARRPRPEIPPEFKAEPIEKLDEAALIAILKEPGSGDPAVFRKAVASKRLVVIGTKEAVPALAALLGDDHASDYARDALEGIPDPAAGDALRAALPKLKGLVLIGVINSLRRRKDAKAVEPLSKFLHDPDIAVAKAAALAMGDIGGATSARLLRDALGRTRGAARASVAQGVLLCADGMMEQDRKTAMAMLDQLCRPDIPEDVRMPAMHLQIIAAASLDRPRTVLTPATDRK